MRYCGELPGRNAAEKHSVSRKSAIGTEGYRAVF